MKGTKILSEIVNGENSMDEKLMEKIFNKRNLNMAFAKVKANKGKCGVDDMTIEEAYKYIIFNGKNLIREIMNGKYKPKPLLRATIPKDEGDIRVLGIPTVIDRIIQQAIVNELSKIFNPLFCEESYGFRPKKSAHNAIYKACENIDNGYKVIVDIDMEKYFDTINQDRLMYLLTKEISDKRLLKLINRYLYCGIENNKKTTYSKIGVPQGSPLSPLLSNIYLNELDKELHARNIKFIRYADDIQIYVKSYKAGQRVLNNTTKYLENKLGLIVNKEKSGVKSYVESKFLGFSFWLNRQNKCKPTISKQARKKFKIRIKQITKRSRGRSIESIIKELNQYTTGWINYFKISNNTRLISEYDSWIRRKIRVYIYKQWKKIKTRHDNLVKLGIIDAKAWEFANTRKGLWRISKSPILNRTLTNGYIRELGYKSLVTMYSN